MKRTPLNQKIKEVERNLLNLRKISLKQKGICDYDDIEYRGIRNMRFV